MAAVRRGAWVALRYVTTIFFLGVVVQFFLVGYGLFAMKHGATIDNAKSLDPHRGLGWTLSTYGAPLMLILVLLAWPARRLLVAWIVLALLGFFQAILAAAGYHHWGLGMFHPVNAVILLALSGRLAHYAWTTRKSKETETAPAPAPSG
jgi:hypothetical protein